MPKTKYSVSLLPNPVTNPSFHIQLVVYIIPHMLILFALHLTKGNYHSWLLPKGCNQQQSTEMVKEES